MSSVGYRRGCTHLAGKTWEGPVESNQYPLVLVDVCPDSLGSTQVLAAMLELSLWCLSLGSIVVVVVGMSQGFQ